MSFDLLPVFFFALTFVSPLLVVLFDVKEKVAQIIYGAGIVGFLVSLAFLLQNHP